MKGLLFDNNQERGQKVCLAVAALAIILAFLNESSYLYMLIATVMLISSGVEKSEKKGMKWMGTFLYIITFAWYGYQFINWIMDTWM